MVNINYEILVSIVILKLWFNYGFLADYEWRYACLLRCEDGAVPMSPSVAQYRVCGTGCGISNVPQVESKDTNWKASFVDTQAGNGSSGGGQTTPDPQFDW